MAINQMHLVPRLQQRGMKVEGLENHTKLLVPKYVKSFYDTK